MPLFHDVSISAASGQCTYRGRKGACFSLPCAILVAVLAAPSSLAANDAFDLRRLSIDQRLSSGSVQAVIQDRQGFLWIGTRNGLNLYDGYSFTVFRSRSAEAGSLSDNFISALYEDRAGRLWVGTFSGLNRLDRDELSFKHILNDPDDPASLVHPHVTALAEDADGHLWIGTRAGLDRLDPATGELEHFRGLDNDDINALHVDRRGLLWIATHGGLYRHDPRDDDAAAFLPYRHAPGDPESLADEVVWAIHEDPAGSLWIGTAEGLRRLPPSSRTRDAPAALERFEIAPPDEAALDIRTIFYDEKGRLWLGTEFDGLYIFDPATSQTHHHRHDPDDLQSLSSNRVTVLVEDAAGILWVGTNGGGVNKIVRDIAGFAHERQDPGDRDGEGDGDEAGDGEEAGEPINDQIRALTTDAQGFLWVGTEGGVFRFDPQILQTTHYRHDPRDPASLGSDRVLAILEDGRGRIWLGTKDAGLDRLERTADGDERFIHYRHDPDDLTSLPHDTVTVLYEDHTSALWVGTYTGLGLYEETRNAWRRFEHDPRDATSLSNNLVTAIHEDRDEDLWIGTYVGLNRLDRERGVIEHYLRAGSGSGGLSDSRIWALDHDDRDRLYVGTSGGLNVYDPQTESFVHHPASTPERDLIHGIAVDERGKVWLASSGGLSEFDPTSGAFVEYGPEDGLPSVAYHPGASHQSASGEIFFGGDDGFTHFFPKRVQKSSRQPPIELTGFRKFNNPVSFGRLPADLESISLSYKDNFITFEFAALDFQEPDKNRFRYQLENFHPQEDWVDSGTRHEATFTNLGGGDYVFRVKGASSTGVWNLEGLAIPVHVEPPFWQTLWFKLSSVLMISVLVLTTYQIRTRGIQDRNRQLQGKNIILNREIERRKAIEEEHQRVITELETKNAEMERFTYTVSHDLKSPLFTIQGFLGMLEKDARDGNIEQMQRDMAQIRGAAGKMRTLLEELLELSRIGRIQNELQEVDLGDIAREAVELVGGQIAEAGVEVRIDPELPTIGADRPRILEVYQNLVDNAVKFMGDRPEPRIEIGQRRPDTASTWQERDNLKEDDDEKHPGTTSHDETVFFVRDNGAGIDPRYHDKIFGLFERLDSETDGTGVGLALVKRVIEVHGGQIWVESGGRGQGCTMCFTLAEKG